MSKSAYAVLKGNGFNKDKVVIAAELTEEYICKHDFYCDICGCPLFVKRGRKSKYFSAYKGKHNTVQFGLHCPNDKRRKKNQEFNIGSIICNEGSILRKEKRYSQVIKAVERPQRKTGKSEADIVREEEEEINYSLKPRNIMSLRNIFSFLCNKNLNEEITYRDRYSNEIKCKVREHLIHKYTISSQNYDLTGNRVIVCVPTSPTKYGVRKEFGYICFRTQTLSPNDPGCFLKIKIKNEFERNKFTEELFHTNKYKNDYLVILGEWEYIGATESGVDIYYSEINRNCIYNIPKIEADQMIHH